MPILTDDELVRMLEAAKGTDFNHRRDTAIIRLLLDGGVRLDELATLKVTDVYFRQDVAHVMGQIPDNPRAVLDYSVRVVS